MDFNLAFNDSGLSLPEHLTQDWKPPKGYYLEGYTDEVHLHRDGEDDPCAGWQAE